MQHLSPEGESPSLTPQAQKLLEVAFMLCWFKKHGAHVDTMVLGWAKSMLWRNGETAP